MRGTPEGDRRDGARRWALVLALACVAAITALPPAALGYTAAPGYGANDYASGFPSNHRTDWGPIGLAFDDSDNLYVADNADGNIYRFQPGGGRASAATRLTSTPIAGDIKGLAITRDGAIYLARSKAGDVVQIDPATGGVTRTVISGIPCATGLAVDPLSGDLFVSQNECGPTIYRISGFASGPGTASTYASLCCVDGIAFGPDGTLYAMSAGQAVKIDGTNSPTPGATRALASVPHADGVTVGPPDSAGGQPFLVVNGNDGRVTRVDFSQSPPTQTRVLSGGSRGDFAAVDSRGCLYATQSASIVRIAPSGRACDLTPSTPSPEPGGGPPPRQAIAIDVVSPRAAAAPIVPGAAPRCVRLGRLVLRVRQRGRVRLRWVKVYIGKRRVTTLHNRRVTSRIVLRRLPRGSFTVKLVAKTTHGRTLKSKRRFRNC